MYHMYNPVGRLKTRFSLKEGTCAKALRTLRKPQKKICGNNFIT